MFYVSNINGAQVPFDPQATPISSVIEIGAVQEVQSSSFKSTTDDSVTQSNTNQLANDDAATNEISSFSQKNFQSPKSIEHTNISRAGATFAYRIQDSSLTRDSSVVKLPEQVESVYESPVVNQQLTHSQQRTSPQQDSSARYKLPLKQRKPVVMASDIMSSPVFSLIESETVERAEKIFLQHGFRHVPVLSSSGKLVGVLSDRDFWTKVLPAKGESRLIKDRMVTNILTARPQTEVVAIAAVMISHRVGCMPIVDEQQEMVGILTRSDILRAIVNHAPIELWT